MHTSIKAKKKKKKNPWKLSEIILFFPVSTTFYEKQNVTKWWTAFDVYNILNYLRMSCYLKYVGKCYIWYKGAAERKSNCN